MFVKNGNWKVYCRKMETGRYIAKKYDSFIKLFKFN